MQAKNVFGLGPISETLTYVTESGVYPVITCNNKLWDAPSSTVQHLAKSFCYTAARKHLGKCHEDFIAMQDIQI